MPFVMVDTSVALPATLSPRGMARKFWVVLALGALTYDVEDRELELDELRREAAATGGTLGGIEAFERLIEKSQARRAALAEHLPVGTPDDWVAVGSRPLFDEYERKLHEVGRRIAPKLRRRDIPKYRRQLESICVAGAPPFDAFRAPGLTRDPDDDAIVLGALLADVDYLVSDDKDIVPNRDWREYEWEEHRIQAVSFNYLASELTDEIDWDGIDGGLLELAYAELDLDLEGDLT